ncbi:MAG: MoxR family ATPase [Nitrospinae bacterium]|nr:MoxR family ATPase [Nitrospinota bacterium]
MSENITEITEEVKKKSAFVDEIKHEVGKNIIGQHFMVERMLIGLLSDGHLLLEGLPGLAKTLAVKTLAKVISVDFNRVQFTPDLLPADIIGTEIYRQNTGEFEVKKGAIFSNIILADEINRAPSKVQSALLETMEERQITIGGKCMKLPDPFIVLATENPIEQEGTYPLPEAQVDRFMLKVKISYPTKEEEIEIIKLNLSEEKNEVKPIINANQLRDAKETVKKIYMDEKLRTYIANIVFATRFPDDYGLSSLKAKIQFGASPRASINLAKAARAFAFLKGRGYVTPQDVKSIGYDVLRHRILLSYEAEAEGIDSDEIIATIFNNIEVP